MSTIFISHSSKDNEIASQVKTRLREQGYRVFFDFDPEHGIPAGSNWEKELYTHLRGCWAVVVLCSEHSMASHWCFAEFAYARFGKAIVPFKVASCTVTYLLRDTQIIALAANSEEGYLRLWSGLNKAGLDPSRVLDWNGQRTMLEKF